MKKILKSEKFIFSIILIMGILLRIIFIGKIPNGIHVDEAGMGYDALSLSKFGVDRYLYKLPVYLVNFGGGQSALYAYLTVIFIKVWGLSIVSIRLPSLIVSVIALAVIYFMAKENKDKNFALLLFALVSIAPWHIMQSRWGLDCNLLSSFIIFSIFFLSKAINNNDIKFYIISGMFFGITLYTYALSYLIIPITLLLTFMYLIYQKKVSIKQIVSFGVPLFFIALPLMLMILINNGYIPEIRNKFFSIPKLPAYRESEIAFSNIFENKDIFKKLLLGNHLVYNSFEEFGTIYIVSIPLLVIGFVIAIKNTFTSMKKKEYDFDCLILIIFLVTLFCSVLIKEPNVNKANAIYIPMIYLCVLAIRYLSITKAIKIIIAIMYLISFLEFSKFYFIDYNKTYTPQIYFETGLIDAINGAEKHRYTNPDSTVYMSSKYQPYIYVLFATKISPYEFNEKGIEKYIFDFNRNDIDINGIYILPKEDEMIKLLLEQDFEIVNCHDYNLLYKGEK